MDALARAGLFLREAESRIAILDRTRPTNAVAEAARLLAEWNADRPAEPRWSYGPVPRFDGLASALAQLQARADREGGVWELYGARAEELGCELQVVSAVGESRLQSFAARRYSPRCPASAAAAKSWAMDWTAERPAPHSGGATISDDLTEPLSLVNRLSAEIGERRLPYRVVVRPGLASVAAVGEGVIFIKPGVRLSRLDVRRTVLHEVDGHVMRRVRAAREKLLIFSVGSRYGGDDEEGHALLLERRCDVLDAVRRFELGLRHLAALAVRGGATFVETVRLLTRRDAPLESALRVAQRAHRGGGLAREQVYLPAFFRVGRAIGVDTGLESWLTRGRLSVEAAGALRTLLQDKSPASRVASAG